MSVRVMRVGLGCRARKERSLARERRYAGTAQGAANSLLHREERRVASHTRDEQRRNASQSGPQRPYTHTKTAL